MKIQELITNRHTRSYVFLIITVIVIFAINSLLPTIEGKTHYTADAVSMTYAEYKELKSENINYNLTWKSEQEIEEYIKHYRQEHEDVIAIEPPDEFVVEVYTRYFFTHTFWYVTTLTRVVSAVLLFYSMFNYLLTKHRDTHKRYVDLETEMVTLANNDLDPSTFEPWMVDVFNKDRKIKQHISNVKYAISSLEHKTNYRTRLLATTDPTNEKCIKYVEAKADLESQLTDEYINDIVVHKPVDNFKYIHPTFVTCGVNRIGHTTDGYSLIESDAKYLSRDVIKRALMSMMITVMFATLLTVTVVTASGKPWYWIIIDVLTTMAPLLIQIPMAYDYCNVYMEEHLIVNLLNRKAIALLYLAYMKEGEKHEEDITRN